MQGERKRKHSLRSIWNGINYLVKTGCQWRMLPKSYAKWQLVYYYYKKWGDNEHFDLLLAKIREHIRIKKGQNREASLGIIDSQSVRWGNNRSLNGYDGNKKGKRDKTSCRRGYKWLFDSCYGERCQHPR